MASMTSTKKLHLELLRILALCLVIYNHCGTCRLPMYAEGRWEYWYVLFMNISCKMAVPLFFMISGALLLHKEETYSQLFSKRVLRFVLLLVAFGLLQWGWLMYSGCVDFSLSALGLALYDGSIQGISPRAPFVAWFLYAYLALLLLLPFLRKMARWMDPRDFKYMMCLQLVLVAIVPSFVHWGNDGYVVGELQRNLPFSPLSETVPFSAMYGAFYMLVGHYLEHRVDSDALQRHFGKLLVAALLSMGIACVLVNYHRACLGAAMPKVSCSYWCDFLLLPCIAVFILAKKLAGDCKPAGRCGHLVCLVSSGVFAGLLVENICRAAAGGILLRVLPPMHNYAFYCFQVLLTVTLALLVGVVLKCLPGVRRLV